jgi:hypothetical protein
MASKRILNKWINPEEPKKTDDTPHGRKTPVLGDDSPLISFDVPPKTPVSPSTAELHTAVSQALNDAENSLLISQELLQAVQITKALVANSSDPEIAQRDAQAVHKLMERVDDETTQNLAAPLGAAIQKHAKAMESPKTAEETPEEPKSGEETPMGLRSGEETPEEPKTGAETPKRPRTDEEPKTTDGPKHVPAETTSTFVNDVRNTLSELADLGTAAPDVASKGLKDSLAGGMLLMNEPVFSEGLSPEDKKAISTHLANLTKADGTEPSAKELEAALEFQKKMIPKLAGFVADEVEKTLDKSPGVSKKDREWARKELGPELQQLRDIAAGKPIYKRPSDPPPKGSTKPGADKPGANKDDIPTEIEAYQQQEKMMTALHEAQERITALELFYSILKKGRDFLKSMI